jgi:hypothetical protein
MIGRPRAGRAGLQGGETKPCWASFRVERRVVPLTVALPCRLCVTSFREAPACTIWIAAAWGAWRRGLNLDHPRGRRPQDPGRAACALNHGSAGGADRFSRQQRSGACCGNVSVTTRVENKAIQDQFGSKHDQRDIARDGATTEARPLDLNDLWVGLVARVSMSPTSVRSLRYCAHDALARRQSGSDRSVHGRSGGSKHCLLMIEALSARLRFVTFCSASRRTLSAKCSSKQHGVAPHAIMPSADR